MNGKPLADVSTNPRFKFLLKSGKKGIVEKKTQLVMSWWIKKPSKIFLRRGALLWLDQRRACGNEKGKLMN